MQAESNPKIDVQLRQNSGKGVARKLRAQGLIPGVIYGYEQDAKPLSLNPKDLSALVHTNPLAENVVFDLEVSGGEAVRNVMIKDYQIDPVSREVLHVDFYSVDLDLPVRATVPVVAEGRALGVRQGGMLSMVRPFVQIRSKPKDIPVRLTVDVTDVGPGGVKLASEVPLPEGVEAGFKGDYPVLRVVMPRRKATDAESEEAEPVAK